MEAVGGHLAAPSLSLMYQVKIFRGAERGWQNCSPRGYKAACELQARVKRILPLNPVRLVCLSPELPCFN